MRRTIRNILPDNSDDFGIFGFFRHSSSLVVVGIFVLVPVCNDCLTVCINEKIYFWFL